MRGRVWGVLFQLFVTTYGGYFGASILMLGSLGVMGLRDVHVINAMKTTLGDCCYVDVVARTGSSS